MKTNMKTNAFAYSSKVEAVRLNKGKPIIGPTSNWWEDGVTFNPAVLFLERSPQNDPIISKLLNGHGLEDSRIRDGIVVVHYRARPLKENDTKRPFSRSFSGLAIYTPELKLIHRHKAPVIIPDDDENHYDYVGIEDGRLHCFDNTYYYLYCGVSLVSDPRPDWPIKAQICLAKSKDLLKWKKLGPIPGNINTKENNNKNGVFFPEKINGYYFMLHRPCFDASNYSKYAIALAMSSSIEGSWEDLGMIKHASQDPKVATHIWVGAGAVPIALGNKKYLVIYHRGHVLNSGEKWYDLHAAIFNFNKFDPAHPHKIIEKRLERLLVPETPHERVSISNDGNANVVFTCGCYEYNGYIYILYGGADCHTLAARIRKDSLLDAIDNREEVPISEKVPFGMAE